MSIEERVRAALRGRADRAVAPPDLAARVRRQARVVRRRRAAGSAVVLAAVVAAGVPAGLHLAGGSQPLQPSGGDPTCSRGWFAYAPLATKASGTDGKQCIVPTPLQTAVDITPPVSPSAAPAGPPFPWGKPLTTPVGYGDRLYEPAGRRLLPGPTIPGGGAQQLVHTPYGALVGTASSALLIEPDGTVQDLSGPGAWGLAVSADGRRLAWEFRDGARLVEAELPSGRVLHQVTRPHDSRPVGFVADGRVVVEEGEGKAASGAIWDPATGQVSALPKEVSGVVAAAGHDLAVFRGDGACATDLYDVGSGAIRALGDGTCVDGAVFSPDGSRLAGFRPEDVEQPEVVGLPQVVDPATAAVDGRLRTVFAHLPMLNDVGRLAWEDDQHVLVVVGTGGASAVRAYVVRCDVGTATCETAGELTDPLPSWESLTQVVLAQAP